jgi:hypothetical protein
MNTKQKIVVTGWILISAVIGWQWMMQEQYGFEITYPLYILFVMVILAIPAVILFKLWADKKK